MIEIGKTRTTTPADYHYVSSGLSLKQKLQLEIITIDEYLETLSDKHPESKHTLDSFRDTLGRIVHLAEGLDVDKYCSNPFMGME